MMGPLPFGLVPVSPADAYSGWWLFAAYFITGVGVEPFIIFWQVALRREFRTERLARVTAVDWPCGFALMPLGLR